MNDCLTSTKEARTYIVPTIGMGWQEGMQKEGPRIALGSHTACCHRDLLRLYIGVSPD